MDIFRNYISVILNGVHMREEERRDFEDEILDHLNMLKKEYMEQGYSEEEATGQAIQKFGETEDINKKYKKTFSPYHRMLQSLKPKAILKESLQWAFCLAATFILSLSINSFAFAGTQVMQSSMQNTLFEGQRLIENKMVYHYSTPKRGDIVIINEEEKKGIIETYLSNAKDIIERFQSKPVEEEGRLIKRVIGIPGDVIDIKNGNVYINDELYQEGYVKGKTDPNSTEFPITVPEDKYFVMGDNREVSLDSRDLGMFRIDQIEGKAVLRLWPLDKFGSVSNK